MEIVSFSLCYRIVSTVAGAVCVEGKVVDRLFSFFFTSCCVFPSNSFMYPFSFCYSLLLNIFFLFPSFCFTIDEEKENGVSVLDIFKASFLLGLLHFDVFIAPYPPTRKWSVTNGWSVLRQ